MTPRLLALALVLLLPAIAYTQDDLAILATQVPPKVVMLLDTSGSMRIAIPHDDFVQQSVLWHYNDRDPVDQRMGAADECDFADVPDVSGSDPLCPGSAHGTDNRCPQNENFPFAYGGTTYTCKNIASGCTYAPPGWAAARPAVTSI